MERLACRVESRVMVPRTMVPVEGTRGPAGREMERVG